MNEIAEHPLTIIGVVGTVLGAFGWFFWSFVKSQTRKMENEGSLDDRVMKYLGGVEKAYSGIIKLQTEQMESMRGWLAASHTDLRAANERIGKMHDDHHEAMTNTIAKVRAENIEATKRLHDRLDHTVAEHAACTQALTSQGAEIKLMKELLTQTHGMPLSIAVSPTGAVQVGTQTVGPNPSGG
jgi:hypothetical protein